MVRLQFKDSYFGYDSKTPRCSKYEINTRCQIVFDFIWTLAVKDRLRLCNRNMQRDIEMPKKPVWSAIFCPGASYFPMLYTFAIIFTDSRYAPALFSRAWGQVRDHFDFAHLGSVMDIQHKLWFSGSHTLFSALIWCFLLNFLLDFSWIITQSPNWTFAHYL